MLSQPYIKRYNILKILVALLLCIATIRVFYPGSYNNDTWTQYIHMLREWTDDWFGPGLWLVWKYLIKLTGTYMSLFYLLMISYWVLLLLLVWNAAFFSVRFWLAMAMGVFFSFIPQYLMRDTMFAIEWSFGFLFMLRLSRASNGLVKLFFALLVVGIMIHGLLLRSNAVVGLVPFAWGLVLAYNNRQPLWRSALVAAVLSVLLIITAGKLLYGPLKAHRVYPEYKLKLLDIAGITRLSGQNYIPECLIRDTTFDSSYVMDNYSPASFDHIYWAPVQVIPSPTAEINDCVTKAWKKALMEHPGLYLKNRVEGFLSYLRINKRYTAEQYWNVNIEIDPENPEGLTMQPNKLRDKFKAVYNKLSLVYFFDTWIWLVINMLLFAFTLYRYNKTGESYLQILACIQLSAIAYLLSQFFVYQDDRYFRYNYWNVMVVILTAGSLRRSHPAHVT